MLETFQAWLTTEAGKLLPKEPMRQAIDYALSNWAARDTKAPIYRLFGHAGQMPSRPPDHRLPIRCGHGVRRRSPTGDQQASRSATSGHKGQPVGP